MATTAIINIFQYYYPRDSSSSHEPMNIFKYYVPRVSSSNHEPDVTSSLEVGKVMGLTPLLSLGLDSIIRALENQTFYLYDKLPIAN